MRMQAGEIDFRVLVAAGVKVHEAMDQIDERPCYVFEIEFEDGPPGSEITTGDVYLIRRCDDVPQSIAVCNAIGDFVNFNNANGEPFVAARTPCVLGSRIRRPSMAVYPCPPGPVDVEALLPTVLLEVEFEPRSLQAMHAYCLDYFREPCVRAVLLLKYFPQHAANRTLFEAVAVLYRRAPPSGGPAVADAVSFGTAPLSPDPLDGTPPDIGRALRVLPAPPLARAPRAADRWATAVRPFLTVPAADLHLSPEGDGPPGREGAPAPAGARDLTLGLWYMRRAGALRVPSRLVRARPPLDPLAASPAPGPPRLRS
jgi:hypothetical protein